jgi:hypothetical protein
MTARRRATIERWMPKTKSRCFALFEIRADVETTRLLEERIAYWTQKVQEREAS